MKTEFAVGKRYHVWTLENEGMVTVEKRTKCYVTVSGNYNGRYWIHRRKCIGGYREYILITTDKTDKKAYQIYCCAEYIA